MQNSRRVFAVVSNLRQAANGGVEPKKSLLKTEPQPIGTDLLKSIGGGKKEWAPTTKW